MDKRHAMLRVVRACATLLLVGSTVAVVADAQALTPIEQLGKAIFFDQNLSINSNQSCATCHGPAAGWTGPDSVINAHGAVYEGSIPGAFGDRKPPSSAYATFAPILYVDKKGRWTGGNFWDGRATGWTLGNPAAEQALGPFLNPMEQALNSPADVVMGVCTSSYGGLFVDVWGPEACGDPDNVDVAYRNIGYSVAAYEASPEVNAFTAKFDHGRLTPQELRGYGLFRGKGKCARCHTADGQKPLFTDFTYDNLGLPKNPENPFYASYPAYLDEGLGGFLRAIGYGEDVYGPNIGKHKVPTLRNVDKWDDSLGPRVKAYGHNGYFKSLEGIVNFYNTRDVKPVCPGDYTEAQALAASCWPAPEIAQNVNTAELGNLGLTAAEEAAIVAFMKTLSDGYQ